MNPRPGDDEQQLLQHIREHSQAQPSARLDARILAASREQIAARPASFWQRLLASSPRGRWSAAFGCIAVLGIGLGLSLQTLQQTSERFDMPASMLQRAPESLQLERAATGGQSGEAPKVMARMAAKTLPMSPDLHDALREILQLRGQGRSAEAQQRIEALREAHPDLDIDAQLQQMSPP